MNHAEVRTTAGSLNRRRTVDALWLLAFAGMLAGVRIGFISLGSYPTNDDWVYGKSAELFAVQSRWQCVTIDGQVSPTSIVPIFAGGVTGRMFGFSFLMLHGVTLGAAWMGVSAVYLFSRYMGSTAGVAGMSASFLAFNPWYWQHAFSFMTDVYSATFVLAAGAFYAAGVARESRRLLFVGSLFLWAAVWSRQTALAMLVLPLLASMVAALSRWRAPSRSEKRASTMARFLIDAFAAGAVPIAALCALEFGLFGQGTIDRAEFVARKPPLVEWLRVLVYDGYGAVLTIGWSLVPAGILVASTLPRSRLIATVFLAMLAPLGFFLVRGGRAVLTEATGTCLQNAHFGPVLLSDCLDGARWGDIGGAEWPIGVWQAATIAACVSAAITAAAGFEGCRRLFSAPGDKRLTVEVGLFASGVGAASVLLILMGFHFDRYWLAASVPLHLWVAARLANAKRAGWNPRLGCSLATWVIVVVFAGLAFVFTHDWLAFNQCRWRLVEEYRAEGFATQQIDGGYEVNGWFRADDDPSTPRRPGSEDALWWSGEAVRCVAIHPRTGWSVDRRRSWRCWAVGRDLEIFGLKR